MSEEKKEEPASTEPSEPASEQSAPEGKPPCDGDEYIIPGPRLPDGSMLALRHHADHSVSQGYIRQTADGEPMTDETLLLKKRDGTPYLDIIGSVGELRKGPSKVTTNEYRRGWDEIFGKKPTVGQA